MQSQDTCFPLKEWRFTALGAAAASFRGRPFGPQRRPRDFVRVSAARCDPDGPAPRPGVALDAAQGRAGPPPRPC